MRSLAALLMALGVALGAALSAALALHVTIPGVHWFVLVGLAKLALVGSLGLIAAGGIVRRLAIRKEGRRALASGEMSDRATHSAGDDR